jgi:hypothetical protein
MLKTIAGAVIGEVIGKRSGNHGLIGAGLGIIATRIATRSLPGAMLIGGALLAKGIIDHQRAQKSDDAAK